MGTFLDKNIDDWYQEEEMMSQIFNLAAVITILLSCLGLFAVALLVIEQRTKEIGIRKVLECSLPNLVIVLSKDFIKLVLIALAITTVGLVLNATMVKQLCLSYRNKCLVFVSVSMQLLQLPLLPWFSNLKSRFNESRKESKIRVK
jgi:hypothetical protein